ncbi:serpentine type 7TM GPCR chemoreceptor srd domain-containing protein [Ditylenchus destructor]|uniref:Serpentine type 7TM GPCR chemoreceptor srd domain-containing protein n=1 Tax=Ditylenchus destructor TaxID=166010 RepID=A0AAD4MQT9_9BILA|nr:serpentine type 7TM GPCR chemoreceptor srd domain-containing protein [Ditylenchus destructor]
MSEIHEEFQPTGQHVFDLNSWPARNDGKHLLIAGAYFTEWSVISYLSLWIITCSVSIVTVIWCEKKITNHFSRLGGPIHVATQRMHTEFHRALLAMAICPLITTTVPVYYFCATFMLQVCPGPISAIMTGATSFITFFNPLTTILCFRCYRLAAVRILSCAKGRNSINPTRSFGTQSNSYRVQDNTPTVEVK